jgi:hypothetical protein
MQVEVDEGQRSLAVNTEVTKMFLIIIFISPSNAKVTIIVIACAGTTYIGWIRQSRPLNLVRGRES